MMTQRSDGPECLYTIFMKSDKLWRHDNIKENGFVLETVNCGKVTRKIHGGN